MAGFIQIIEFTTTRMDELRALMEEQIASGAMEGSVALRGTTVADKDRPNTYMNIVEFESYEAAMQNSNRPETSEMASKMAELCDGPPRFYNLDVLDTFDA